MNKKASIMALSVLAISLLFYNSVSAAYRLDAHQLARELTKAGYKVIGEADYYGVPCLKMTLPVGQAIYQVCRRVPLLNEHYFETREAIAVVNVLNMFYARGIHGYPNETKLESISIPLDTFMMPRIFPDNEQKFAQYPKFILVDRAKQLMAYYEYGELVACFPVSTGRPGKKTPAMEGWINIKAEDHTSTIYDSWMPYSMLLLRPYFLHAGVMSGHPDSAGNIRMFMEHACWLFQRVAEARVRFKVE